MEYQRETAEGDNWEMVCGDSVVESKQISDNSIDFQIFSPPFANLYIYSDSYRDMGNVKDDDEFFKNFGYLIKELYRIMRPGRLAAIHCRGSGGLHRARRSRRAARLPWRDYQGV